MKSQKKGQQQQQGGKGAKSRASPAAAASPLQQQQRKPKSAAAASSSAAAAASSSAAGTVPSLLSGLRNADSAFASLLGSSLTARDFFTKHWEKEPLHIQRSVECGGSAAAAANFYEGLFSKAKFDSYLRRHAKELKYGFNLNVCVCSEEGSKIDMNPKAEEKEQEDEDEEEEEAAPVQPKKKAVAAAAAPSKKSAAKPAAAAAADDEEEEEVETMTIAQALKLAESQRAKLKPAAAAAAEAEDEEDDGEDDDEDGEMSEDDEEGEDDDEQGEEELDGTSVSTVRAYAPVTFADYDRLYKSGCTVQALQPQQYSHPMWLLLAQLEEYFGGLVGANCYSQTNARIG